MELQRQVVGAIQVLVADWQVLRAYCGAAVACCVWAAGIGFGSAGKAEAIQHQIAELDRSDDVHFAYAMEAHSEIVVGDHSEIEVEAHSDTEEAHSEIGVKARFEIVVVHFGMGSSFAALVDLDS